MKTTNFFTDYIIIGIIATFPVFFFDYESTIKLISYKTKDQGLVLPGAMVAIYLIGIIFNQVSDFLLTQLTSILRLNKIKEELNSFQSDIGISYHEALQDIVYCSPSAYEYLSYRRTVIRIVRSLLISLLLSFFSASVAAIFSLISGIKFAVIYNLSIIAIIALILVFLRTIIIKLQIGFYQAIKNFYKIRQNESQNVNNHESFERKT